MANTFSREERVMFDEVLEGFEDGLVISKAAAKYEPLSPLEMNRTGDKFWIPAPGIAVSYDGFDQTANFGDMTELSVPVSIGYHKSTPVKMTAKDLRSPQTLKRKGDAAKHKLASDINLALFMTVALQGSQVIKRTTAPKGFDDIALADAQLTEQGIGLAGRYQFLAPRVYNAMASDLAKPQTSGLRETMTAYQRARISDDVAGFEVFKNDQTFRLAAAGGGATTVNGANQYWVPKSTSTAATGETENVDNRYSVLNVTAATYAAIKAGDAFTIPGVNSVHMITKQDTGQLQTFRVIGKPSANAILVAPAIISGQGGTRAELEFKNVTATPAAGAAITWLNTAAAELNPFFKKESLLLLPGSFQVDAEDGWQVLRGTTENGLKITYTRQGEINDLTVKARWDIDFGTALINPQMAGVTLFNQT